MDIVEQINLKQAEQKEVVETVTKIDAEIQRLTQIRAENVDKSIYLAGVINTLHEVYQAIQPKEIESDVTEEITATVEKSENAE